MGQTEWKKKGKEGNIRECTERPGKNKERKGKKRVNEPVRL